MGVKSGVMVRAKRRNRIYKTNNLIRLLRVERRWTQGELAVKMRFQSKFRIWQLENEIAEPTAEERRKLATIFRVPATTIFPQPKRLAS